MPSRFAIRATNLGKCYRIYDQPLDRLKQALWRGRKLFYREFWALRDVSFEVRKGETIGIIGSNGSGKTTLLQLICGTLIPTQGELEISGKVAALLELGAGFNPDFTGRENVYINAAIMGLSRAEADAQYGDIASFADIGDFINEPVKTYSSGMYVRLAFAVAVHVSPDVLIVDEALSVGDIRFQQKCIERIKRFCRVGTVIFVSHDTAAVTELCSRVFWIDSGRIQMEGSPKLVVERYHEYMYEGTAKRTNVCSEGPTFPTVLADLQVFVPTKDVRQFGNRAVVIEGIRLLSKNGSSLAYAAMPCEISVFLRANETIACPIVGYVVRDRLGREIFADNTALIGQQLPRLLPGKRYLTTFRLEAWPNLLEGDYSLSVAVADGTLHNHVQCHWLHDVLVVRSVPVRPAVGFFSVANTEVSFVEIND